jgi:hypothetical protein
MTIADFAQPATGLNDFIFAGGILTLILAGFWAVSKFFTSKQPEKPKK